MKRFLFILLAFVLAVPVRAEPIKWVDFAVPYESLKYAMDADVRTSEQENHISWIDILAVAACRTGGKCPVSSVKKAYTDLSIGKKPEEILQGTYKYYDYYHKAYTAVLGGMLGHYAVQIDGQWKMAYGLKAFSPVAAFLLGCSQFPFLLHSLFSFTLTLPSFPFVTLHYHSSY